MTTPYRVLVTGSRDWTDRQTVWDALAPIARALPADQDLVLVHGGCPTGADAMCDEWARGYRSPPRELGQARARRRADPQRRDGQRRGGLGARVHQGRQPGRLPHRRPRREGRDPDPPLHRLTRVSCRACTGPDTPA